MKINCPSCEHEFEINTVSTIISQSDEYYKLLKGELNNFNCPSCNHLVHYEQVLRYFDPQKNFVVWLVPLKSGDNEQEVEQQVTAMMNTELVDVDDAERPEWRLTFNTLEFIEKIMINQNGFEDRLIEFIKFQLYNHPKHEIKIDNYQLLYDFSNTTSDKLVFAIFDRNEGKPVSHTHLEMSAYEEIADIYVKTVEGYEELKRIFPSAHVCAGNLYME